MGAVKRLFAILLLLIILVQSTSQIWILVTFYANREYIASNLCINRFNPESSCQGACQLRKQLDKDGEQNNKLKHDISFPVVLLYMLEAYDIELPAFYSEIDIKSYHLRLYQDPLAEGYYGSVFHPPTSLS